MADNTPTKGKAADDAENPTSVLLRQANCLIDPALTRYLAGQHSTHFHLRNAIAYQAPCDLTQRLLRNSQLLLSVHSKQSWRKTRELFCKRSVPTASSPPFSHELVITSRQADKAASSAGGGFSFFGGRSEKWEGAVDLYTQAANAFRMQRAGKEAGQAFEKAAAIQTGKLNEPDDAANTLTEAFKSYKKEEPEDAARCLEQAINHYTMKGNFRRAAGHKQNLAELYEVELGDEKRASEAYETAAGWYENDNAEAWVPNELVLRETYLSAVAGDYPKSVAHYERVARSSINNNLMKWSVKEYLLKAGICHLAANDVVATNRALESYRDLDPSFPGTREHQLLVDLAASVEEGDQEKFADKLFQYDSMSKLDKWKTTLLLRVKDAIEEKGEDFS
nr:putative vesicular-fusion protein sec17 like [Quercus suber]